MYTTAYNRAEPDSVARDLYSQFEVDGFPVYGSVDNIFVDSDPIPGSLEEEVQRLREQLIRVEVAAYRGLKLSKTPVEKSVCRWVVCHIGAIRELTEPFGRTRDFSILARLLKWVR